MGNSELLAALDLLEKERGVDKAAMIEAMEASLVQACKNTYGKPDKKYENLRAVIDMTDGEFHVYSAKTVVETVEDGLEEISLKDAHAIDGGLKLGDVVTVEVDSKHFSRIASMNSKSIIVQRIREEENKSLLNEYQEKEGQLITGVVQRYIGRNLNINLGRADGFLAENEQVRGERWQTGDRIRVYVKEVREQTKGLRIRVSRTNPELVRRLFEEEVAEIRDGIVEIVGIAREAGSRTKMSVWSNDPDVDAVGACVGVNGSRVNAVVDELHNEKIDIINWDENPAILIENALSPAKVIAVAADPDERTAKVVVPDYQLSLAIGKEGQNARLAARLTGFKIDIKSETQAQEAEGWLDYDEEYDEYDDGYGEYDDEYGEYDESYDEGYDDEAYDDGAYGEETYEEETYGEAPEGYED